MVGHARECTRELLVFAARERPRRTCQQTFAVAHKIVDAIGAERAAEVLRRDVLELVGLVDDERRTERNHFSVFALPDRCIRAQQMVVDDDDVGLGGALAHARDETFVVAGTLGAEARVGLGGDLVPERKVLGQIAQLGAVARLRFLRPAVDDGEQHAIARLDQSAGGRRVTVDAVSVELPPVQAEVVAAPFHQRRFERDAERLLERGQILVEDLFLEVFRAGGHQHAMAAQNRRG